MSHEFDLRRAWLDEAYAATLDSTVRASLPSSPIPAPRRPEIVPSMDLTHAFGCGPGTATSVCASCPTRYSRRPCCG